MICSTRALVTSGPSSRVMPLCTHCQICEREISAVAASSIRLKIATAPLPPSQLARYCSATLTLFRSPPSVIGPLVLATASRSGAVTLTSSRSRPSWLGAEPSAASNTSLQSGTRSGCATQEPSKPSADSRVLSSRAAAVAGLHQQFGVGAHERRRHGHRVALGQHELTAAGAELLYFAVQVGPPARVQPRAVVAQLVEDFLHLERGRDRLDQHGRPDRPAGEAESGLGDAEDVVPQPRLQVALNLGQVEVGPLAL